MDTGAVLFLIPVVWIIMHYARQMVRTTEREKSRREIAAYIAEGSMSAEQGERLLAAGDTADDQE